MSRFHEWTSKEVGLKHWIAKEAEKLGLTLDIRGVKGKTDRYFGVETKKMIFAYFKSKKFRKSYTTNILQTDFHDFVRWWKQQDWSHLIEEPCPK
jgi:hypothetical protein